MKLFTLTDNSVTYKYRFLSIHSRCFSDKIYSMVGWCSNMWCLFAQKYLMSLSEHLKLYSIGAETLWEWNVYPNHIVQCMYNKCVRCILYASLALCQLMKFVVAWEMRNMQRIANKFHDFFIFERRIYFCVPDVFRLFTRQHIDTFTVNFIFVTNFNRVDYKQWVWLDCLFFDT